MNDQTPSMIDTNHNPFIGKSKDELRLIIAENLSLILRNNLALEVYRSDLHVGLADVMYNCHLIDRAGAIVNAMVALDYFWDAERYYTEIKDSMKG